MNSISFSFVNTDLHDKMSLIKFLIFIFSFATSEFFGSYVPRIANWNTGRIYLGEDYGRGPDYFGLGMRFKYLSKCNYRCSNNS